MHSEKQHLEALQDIRQMMQRSSRFISLSGLSGIAAGAWALLGAIAANRAIGSYYRDYNTNQGYSGPAFQQLKLNLLLLAAGVLALSLLSAFYFTWRKTKADQTTLWSHSSRQLIISLFVPLTAGGLFILSMLQHSEWRFVAPGCLLFYGVALLNASKYTLRDIKFLAISEIILGLIATQFIGYGLYFWAVGFGVLHIVYGFIMWWKYERNK